ncbi:MAG: hypothetical protein IT169_09765 [Bryobacterales bacterium]|nr:hypothetical protein [Bryobacterales bacterium]
MLHRRFQWRPVIGLVCCVLLALTVALPAPLRALDAPSLGGGLRIERLAAGSTFLAFPESRQAKPIALTHAALPGMRGVQPLSIQRLEIADAPLANACLRPAGSHGSRAPPLAIPS